MADTQTLRRQFRARLLSDARGMLDQRLGSLDAPVRIVDVPFVLGGPGTPLAGGEHAQLRLSLNGQATVLTWSLAATVASTAYAASVTVDVLNGPTTSALVSLCPTTPPQLAAQIELTEQPPTGWSLGVADPSWLVARVRAVDGVVEVVHLTLRLAIGGAPTGAFITDDTGAIVTDDTGAPIDMEF
jgi:hypothetical protein